MVMVMTKKKIAAITTMEIHQRPPEVVDDDVEADDDDDVQQTLLKVAVDPDRQQPNVQLNVNYIKIIKNSQKKEKIY